MKLVYLPRLISLVFVLALLAGCGQFRSSLRDALIIGEARVTLHDEPGPAALATSTGVVSSPTGSPVSTQAVTDAPTPAVGSQSTATPDTRLPPEDWQDWPVVPQATGRARRHS